jgi:hypothetical protein
MKKTHKPSMTESALKALHEAVAKVVQDHRQQGRPLAVWRDGRAVWISATDATVLREEPTPYRTTRHGKSR